MKQTVKMSRAVGQLEKMFFHINQDFFDGVLPTPIITIQSKPGTWGHMSRAKVWKRKDDNTYEMNIAAESANGLLEEIIDTIIHECVHLYCNLNGIQDVSRGGSYHNKRFKEEAEKRGLVCVHMGSGAGWNTRGEGNDKLIEYALSKDWTELQIGRETTSRGIRSGGATMAPGLIPVPGVKAPSSTRKYKCPCCGNSVRATKEVNILCGDCMVQMIKEER